VLSHLEIDEVTTGTSHLEINKVTTGVSLSKRIKMPKRGMNWANSKFLAIINPYT
jgi:hypothetical protein